MTMPNGRWSKATIKPLATADREAAWAKHTAAMSGRKFTRPPALAPASAAAWTAHAAQVRRLADRKGR